MNLNRHNAFILALAAGLASGCSALVERVEPVAQADQIGVYESAPPGKRPYVLVGRVWTGQWKTAFDVRHYATAEAGAADMRNQAVVLGGNAVMNFGCYRLNPASKPDLVCNGTVVKFAE